MKIEKIREDKRENAWAGEGKEERGGRPKGGRILAILGSVEGRKPEMLKRASLGGRPQ